MELRPPLTVLIAALGGQGGAVLTAWIVQAARAEHLAVQATSTPGVSQRTGATTYYIEIAAALPGSRPVLLGLAPVPGRVDVLVCAELLEAARMLERGMSTPSRTNVVASTHRVYTTREKMSGGDARFDERRVVDAIHALSRRATLFDMEEVHGRHRAAISAVLFGALAGSGALPFRRAVCEDAIRGEGKGVAASLAAFAEGFERAAGTLLSPLAGARGSARGRASDAADRAPRTVTAPPGASGSVPDAAALLPAGLGLRVAALPPGVAETTRLGALALIEYQNARYAEVYVGRVERIAAAARRAPIGRATEVTRETARFLALWMRYDDVIRVASSKGRRARFARIRSGAEAPAGAVVRVHDFFKPSVFELAAVLPRRFGGWLERRAQARSTRRRAGTRTGAGRGLTLHTSSIAGALALRVVAALRPLRPRSLRYGREQQAIENWLCAIEQAMSIERDRAGDAAHELARLPRLIRGYGDTHAAGRDNFHRILDAWRVLAEDDPRRAYENLRTAALAAFNEPACGPEHVPAGVAAGRAAAASSRA